MKGIDKIEKILGVENIYDADRSPLCSLFGAIACELMFYLNETKIMWLKTEK